MEFIQNFPFFHIILCLISSVVSSVLPGKIARKITIGLVALICLSTVPVFIFTLNNGEYVYMMGHFPAPWGNEIRAGVLETLMAMVFCVIMLFGILGGLGSIIEEIEETKQNLYFVMVDLLLSSLLALIYTNDIFTAYVFVEINTIAACSLVAIKNDDNTLVASVKYLIMSLIGSGLFLIGISTLYSITGHLLMSNIRESVQALAKSGEYSVPLTVSLGLMAVGLAIKSALYPFHMWVPSAHGHATATSSVMLSSLVLKGYIFILIKIFYRVFGTQVIQDHKVTNILFLFGIAGMIFASIHALSETNIKGMIAYSSVAQIGYIYMGIGLGTEVGMTAAIFHIMSHAASKSLLFICADQLSKVSGHSKDFTDLKGAGLRNKIAGIGFTVGALSMVGIPLLAGFTSKVYFAEAAFTAVTAKMIIALIALAISTILNALYFMRAVISIYTPRNEHFYDPSFKVNKYAFTAICVFVLFNFALGIFSAPLADAIQIGLKMFS